MPPFAICICSSFYCCCCCRVFFFLSSFCLFLLHLLFFLSFSSLPIATAMDVKDCENQVSGIVITTCWKILKRKLHRTRLSIIIIIWGVCNLSIIAIDEFYRVWSTDACNSQLFLWINSNGSIDISLLASAHHRRFTITEIVCLSFCGIVILSIIINRINQTPGPSVCVAMNEGMNS